MRFIATLDQVRAAIDGLEREGCVEQDGMSGTFSYKLVDGRYKYSMREQELTVTIDGRPLFASEDFIERKIREHFEL